MPGVGGGDTYEGVYPNPQPVAGSLIFSGAIGATPTAQIYTRQRWTDSWTEDTTLQVASVYWAAAPTVPTASLSYRYGPTLERGAVSPTNRTRKAIGGYYVRIVVTCADGVRKWHGFVDDTGDEPGGLVGGVACGEQTFSCVGMVAALDRQPIPYSTVTTSAAFVDSGPYSAANLLRQANPPHFNPSARGESPRQIKNRSTAKRDAIDLRPAGVTVGFARQSYVLQDRELYSQASAGVDWWTPRDILDYLLVWCGPLDDASKERIPFWVYYDGAADTWPTQNYGTPEVDTQGKTLKNVLDELLSSSQSTGYWCWVDESTNRVYLEPYTLLSSDLTIGANTLKANARQFDWTISGDPATRWTTQRQETAIANQIVCIGGKRKTIVSLPFSTGFRATFNATNGALYNEDLVTAFNTLYPVATSIKEEYARQDARRSARWWPIGRHYAIVWSWIFQYQYPSGTNVNVFRWDENDLAATGGRANPQNYFPSPKELRILDYLPLKAAVNYETGAMTVAEMQDKHATAPNVFRGIECYGKTPVTVDGSGFPTGYLTQWTQRASRPVLYDIRDPDYALEIKPLPADQGIGLEINVVGAQQDVIDSAVAGVPPLPLASSQITFAFEDDRRAYAFANAGSLSGVDAVLRRTFDFGDRFQVIEILPGTITGIKNTTDYELRTDRVFVRDDRPKLKEIADQVVKWYAVPRNVVRVNSRRVTATIWPGQLIKQLNPTAGTGPFELDVNSVVTGVEITFERVTSGPARAAMQVTTTKGEFDPLAFFPPSPEG
jgi:hypothetical protein